MDEEIDVSVTVEQLKAAGTGITGISKQVPALLKLGEWYLTKAKTTSNGADFTKANALYNAALVRSRSVNHEIDEDQILGGIVEAYREFLRAFANVDGISEDEIRNEIDSHKKFVAEERQKFKAPVDEIDSCCNKTDDKTETKPDDKTMIKPDDKTMIKPDDKTMIKPDDKTEIHAEKMYKVFQDIQDMYIRLVSMLAKECESRLGKPPCDYAIIALGSVARMEATPFSDLEFAILYSDPTIGDKISYFRVLSHFLHLKVINLGETILPALGIEELNDFQSSDHNSDWFYDSETPRGISFDGAMPWASKTPLGRMATKNKPAVELIRTPKEMAKLQDEEIAVKEGYHLADIMSRAALLYGDQALLDEYNERVAEKLNTKSSVINGKSTKTVGFTRGIQVMMLDVDTYDPFNSYLGVHLTVGALFDAKKQFYRLISLLLSDLGLIFDIRSPSPWQVILELQSRGIIRESKSVNVKVCLSIANEIRLKTYFANNGQKELFSPVPQNANTTEQSADVPIFRDFNEDMLVRLLITSNDMCSRCREFCLKYIQEDNIDVSLFQNPSLAPSKALLLGNLYYRLQILDKALEWMKSESKDSPDYLDSLNGQGLIYLESGEYDKSVECFEEALQLYYQNGAMSILDVLKCINGLAAALIQMGKYRMATIWLEEGIRKHSEIYGEGSQSIVPSCLLLNLGYAYHQLGNFGLAVKTFKEVQEMKKGLTNVPDQEMIHLNLNMAWSLSELDQHAQSLKYLERALQLSQMVFGEHTLSIRLVKIYNVAGNVYGRCNLDNEAVSFPKRSLDLFHLVFGDKPHPVKIGVLKDLGTFFSEKHRTSEAVENLESALEQARTLYPHGKAKIIVAVLNNLGVALFRAVRLEESLPYFQEAKEIMDQIPGPDDVHRYTSDILYNMGTNYHKLGDLSQALQCFNDALSINFVIYGENSIYGNTGGICSNFAYTAEKMGNFSLAKEYYTKAVKIFRKISLTKNSCRSSIVSNLYRLSFVCLVLGEKGVALKHLEEAREIAKDAGFKDWMVVNVLVALIKKYAEMGCIIKSMMCYVEAGAIAKSLPEHDSLQPSILEMLKLMNILLAEANFL